MSYLRSIVICNFCSFTDAERLVLEEDLKRTQLNAYAPGTHKNHRSQWKSYLTFCLHFDLTPVPATAHVIALYCQSLSRSLTPQSIRNYLSGVKLLHLVAGFEFPFLQSHEVCLLLKGLQRTVKHTPNRAPPITPDILSKLVSVTDLADGQGVMFVCAFLFPFRCGVPGELIQIFGDWASDAYKTYLEISLPAKVQVAEQMKLRLLQNT